MGFLAFPDTIGTGLGLSETNLENLKSFFAAQPGVLKKSKNSRKVGEDFILSNRDSDFRNPHPILHKKWSIGSCLKTRFLIWHFFIVKSTAGPV